MPRIGKTNEPALGELPIRYADYAVWQRERTTRGALKGWLDYWRTQLDGSGAIRAADRPCAAARASYQGARLDFEVPRALVDQLRRLSRREGTTST